MLVFDEACSDIFIHRVRIKQKFSKIFDAVANRKSDEERRDERRWPGERLIAPCVNSLVTRHL